MLLERQDEDVEWFFKGRTKRDQYLKIVDSFLINIMGDKLLLHFGAKFQR